ncbi:MAG: PQQ-dependent sugar dehydrogenase [Chloroflexota bacterium]
MRHPFAALLLLTLLGCSQEAPSPEGTPQTLPSSPVGSAATSVGEPPQLELELVAGGLRWPSTITLAPDGTLYVNETRAGLIRAIDLDGTLRPEPFLDFSNRIGSEAERGLLGLALHPDYESNGRLFVHYTRASDGAIVVSELERAADGVSADPTSERVLMTVVHPSAYHNGGQLAFGPDGYLYVGLGDGGSVGDSVGNAQNPEALLGKILRIDVDRIPGGDRNYGIPPDNPYADEGGAPEVYVVGLRNPWRFSFDHATNALWIADVGEGAYEEVNRLDPGTAAGANLGWSVMEGSRCYYLLPCDTTPFVPPITEYHRDVGCAVIGGYVYRGHAIPGLAGWYLFADYCTGAIFGVPSNAQPTTAEVIEPRVLLESGLNVSSFGRGPDGELYVADIFFGTIYRIVVAEGG